MAAAAADRDGQRQPSEYVPYTGASGYTYYKDTLLMGLGTGLGVVPLVQGAGASNAHFLGVVANRVTLGAGLGTSNFIVNTWKVGEFTFAANGTGASSHIGLRAYGIDDQTVGTSAAAPCLTVGEIVGIPSTSTYRVRIDNAINLGANDQGVSWAATQN
jgi:hypothetical protein